MGWANYRESLHDDAVDAGWKQKRTLQSRNMVIAPGGKLVHLDICLCFATRLHSERFM